MNASHCRQKPARGGGAATVPFSPSSDRPPSASSFPIVPLQPFASHSLGEGRTLGKANSCARKSEDDSPQRTQRAQREDKREKRIAFCLLCALCVLCGESSSGLRGGFAGQAEEALAAHGEGGVADAQLIQVVEAVIAEDVDDG